jgi:hypothetical protein
VAGPEQVVPFAADEMYRRMNRVARNSGDPEQRRRAMRRAVDVVVWMRAIGHGRGFCENRCAARDRRRVANAGWFSVMLAICV